MQSTILNRIKYNPFKYIIAGTITGLVIKNSIDSYKAYKFTKNTVSNNNIINNKFLMYRCEISTVLFINGLFYPYNLLSNIVGVPTLMLIHSFKYSIGYYKQYKSLVESFESLEVSMMEIKDYTLNHTNELLTM